MTITIFTSPADRGAASTTANGATLGETWRAEIQATWAAYERYFAAHDLDDGLARRVGRETLEHVAAWAPRLAAEIVGIAEGAALEPWQAAALNARSEVLARFRPATPGECSTSVYLPPGAQPRTIQTWDWSPLMNDAKLIWQYEPRPGWTVKTFTEFGMLAKIGVNSAGLGLHFNLLQHDTDGQHDAIPVHLIARRVLDEASTLAEAEQIVRSAPVSASVALTVVTRDGAACTFEVSPAGVARIPVRPDRFLLHTNHFLDPVLARGERLGTDDPDTYTRLTELGRRATALRDSDIEGRAAGFVCHREDGAALCRHPAGDAPVLGQSQTLLVIGLDLDHARLVFRDGNPCAGGSAWTIF
jgi:isopenicillin-N N-acyltransferase-like protein